jgi:hypothetical protein
MPCGDVKECACPKKECPNNGKCRPCVAKHRDSDGLPFCLFPNNGGDKSLANFYRTLKERFEP